MLFFPAVQRENVAFLGRKTNWAAVQRLPKRRLKRPKNDRRALAQESGKFELRCRRNLKMPWMKATADCSKTKNGDGEGEG